MKKCPQVRIKKNAYHLSLVCRGIALVLLLQTTCPDNLAHTERACLTKQPVLFVIQDLGKSELDC